LLDEIFFFRPGADAPLAAARLMPVRIRRCALDVAAWLTVISISRVSNQVFQLDLVDLVHDLSAAIVSVCFVHFAKLAMMTA